MKSYQVQSYSIKLDKEGNAIATTQCIPNVWTFPTFGEAKAWYDSLDIRDDYYRMNWIEREYTAMVAEICEVIINDEGEIEEYGDCVEYRQFDRTDEKREEEESYEEQERWLAEQAKKRGEV